jgi:DNA-binding beta-propeller fold protein YncE
MRLAIGLAAVVALTAVPAAAEIAVVAVDNKVKLVDGVSTVQANPAPEAVAIIDLKASPPRLVAEVGVPGSVVGPPVSVALTPDESLALVTSAMKIDPADPKKQIPDNRLSVIDLTASPPVVIATLETGAAPAGLSINRKGDLALVANRSEGTVSIFTISGKTVTPAGKVTVADAKSGTSHVAISPDGTMALVSRDGDHMISVLTIEGSKVELAKRDMRAGIRPYGLDISSRGDIAVVANIGVSGSGDADTISVIDLKAKPARVIDTITVGHTPEGIKMSPDGSLVGVVVMNGSNQPKNSPFFADAGKLVVFKVDGQKLTKAAEAPIGHWSQGVVFSADNKTVLVTNMVEENVQSFSWDGTKLAEIGTIKLKGGGAAIRTAERPL